ncbi:uncharacterized protein [Penaeus vannamei]|uniref:uncharacterized protein n=1 Tax=Penaeus vannamei TaxID=6689 RepID=UPI00387F4B37
MGSTIHHTTSYNPEVNGMVERSHRPLKAALMARCTKSDWKAQLPWVLLGIRTSPKEGLQVSPAEALTVPGEFFPSLDTPTDSEHLTKLRHAVEKYRPCTQTHSTSPPQYLPKLIHSCKYVFVRNDAHGTPLTRPYRGPYAVLERNPKVYRLSIGGKSDWVSIDRLKSAYLEEKEPTQTTPLADNPAHTVPPSNAPAHVSHPEDKPFQISSQPQRDACCPLLITSPSCNITLYDLDPNTLAACSFSEPSLHPARGVRNTLDGSQPDDTLLIPSSPF